MGNFCHPTLYCYFSEWICFLWINIFVYILYRSHWILCVIHPYNNIVYYLDSLHNQEDIGTGKGVNEDLREIVDIALFQFRSELEITRKLKMDTKWITIQVWK
ncbi:Clustered mitochondria protein-like protein [Bienertia sinuspersici]